MTPNDAYPLYILLTTIDMPQRIRGVEIVPHNRPFRVSFSLILFPSHHRPLQCDQLVRIPGNQLASFKRYVYKLSWVHQRIDGELVRVVRPFHLYMIPSNIRAASSSVQWGSRSPPFGSRGDRLPLGSHPGSLMVSIFFSSHLFLLTALIQIKICYFTFLITSFFICIIFYIRFF
jgi:hypothetical protein